MIDERFMATLRGLTVKDKEGAIVGRVVGYERDEHGDTSLVIMPCAPRRRGGLTFDQFMEWGQDEPAHLSDWPLVFQVPGGGDYSNMELEIVTARCDEARGVIVLETGP